MTHGSRRFPHAAALAALAACAMLAGCFGVEQSLTIEDGRASYSAEVSVDAKLAAMGEARGSPERLCDKLNEAVAGMKGEVQVQTSQAMRGGDVVCRMSVSGPLAAMSVLDLGKGAGGKASSSLSLEKVDDSTFRLTSRVGEDAAGRDRTADGLLAAMFAGREFKWTVRAPRIVESNGVVAPDGRSVVWAVPVVQTLQSPQTFVAVIQIDLPWYLRVALFFKRLVASVQDFLGGLFGSSKPQPTAQASPTISKATERPAQGLPAPGPAPAPAPAPAPEPPAPDAPSAPPIQAAQPPQPAPARASDPALSRIDGTWYSDEWKYGYTLQDGVGTATVSNSPAFKPGDRIIMLQPTGADTFEGQQVYRDGKFYRVKVVLEPDGRLRFDGERNVQWTMRRVSSRTGF